MTTTGGEASVVVGLEEIEIGGFDLDRGLRIVWGILEGLRRVGGAILTLLDHTLFEGFSSSDDDGGGRSPYNPPSILYTLCVCVLRKP